MADLVCEPVPWEEYHRSLEQVDAARAELHLVAGEKTKLEEQLLEMEVRFEAVKVQRDVYAHQLQVACGFAFDAGRGDALRPTKEERGHKPDCRSEWDRIALDYWGCNCKPPKRPYSAITRVR